MAVRAKVRVTGRHESTSIQKDGGVQQVTVTMLPVYDEGENSQWSKYTPSGELRLTITNPDAYNQFKLGKAFFVDFSEVAED
jgi:hypothetical protein